jgi:hypothetical protein
MELHIFFIFGDHLGLPCSGSRSTDHNDSRPGSAILLPSVEYFLWYFEVGNINLNQPVRYADHPSPKVTPHKTEKKY